MSLSYEDEEESEEESAQIEGNDHYARFYRHLKAEFPWLTPGEFKDALKHMDSVFDNDNEIDEFFEILTDYIANEVSKIIPDEAEHVAVTYDHYHALSEEGIEAYKFTDIVAFVKWSLGGKERRIEVYRKEIASELRIANTRNEFNNLIDKIVKEIAAEASAVVKDLQRSNAGNVQQSRATQ